MSSTSRICEWSALPASSFCAPFNFSSTFALGAPSTPSSILATSERPAFCALLRASARRFSMASRLRLVTSFRVFSSLTAASSRLPGLAGPEPFYQRDWGPVHLSLIAGFRGCVALRRGRFELIRHFRCSESVGELRQPLKAADRGEVLLSIVDKLRSEPDVVSCPVPGDADAPGIETSRNQRLPIRRIEG